MDPSELDFVAFYEKPMVKFERLLETCLAHAPDGFESLSQAIPLWAGLKLGSSSVCVPVSG